MSRAQSARVRFRTLLGPSVAVVAGRRIAFWRGSRGRLVAMDDACCHRSAPLSQGSVHRLASGEKAIRCIYHHWAFSEDGRIRDVPSQSDGRWPRRPVQRTYDLALDRDGVSLIVSAPCPTSTKGSPDPGAGGSNADGGDHTIDGDHAERRCTRARR